MVEGLEEFIKENKIRRRGGKLVLYKAVSKEWGSLYVRMNKIRNGRSNSYCVGTCVKTRRYSNSRSKGCGRGLHVATYSMALDYIEAMVFFDPKDCGRRLIEVLVEPDDVVCVPYVGNKIRCRRLVVSAEIDPTTGRRIRK